jgi:hypothetical protein
MSDLHSRLIPMAKEVFAEIKTRTGLEFPHSSVKEAFESFDSIVATKGIAWLIDNTATVGMTHLGWAGWMANAREVLNKNE